MSYSSTLDLPTGLFRVMSAATYEEDPRAFIQSSDIARRYNVKVFKRDRIDAHFPFLVMQYEDTEGVPRRAVCLKGLFGDDNKIQGVVENVWQAAKAVRNQGAIPEHVRNELQALADRGGIDAVVTHSGGAPYALLLHRILQQRGKIPTTVIFNGQIPSWVSELPEGVVSLSTSEDPLTDFSSRGLTVEACGGGHSINAFSGVDKKGLSEVVQGGVLDEKGLMWVKEHLDIAKRAEEVAQANSDENSAVMTAKARQMVREAKKLQEERQSKLKRQATRVAMLRGAKVAFEVFEGYQCQATSAYQRRVGQERAERYERIQEALQHSKEVYAQQSLLYRRSQTPLQDAQKVIERLENNLCEWNQLKEGLQGQGEVLKKRKTALLNAEIAKDSKLLQKICGALSSSFSAAAVISAPFCPLVGAGLGAAGAGFSALGSVANHGVVRREAQQQIRVDRVAGQIEQNQVEQAVIDSWTRELRDRIVHAREQLICDRNIEPSIRLAALKTSIDTYQAELRELLTTQKPKDLMCYESSMTKIGQQREQLERGRGNFSTKGYEQRQADLNRQEKRAKDKLKNSTEYLSWKSARDVLKQNIETKQEELNHRIQTKEFDETTWGWNQAIQNFWGSYTEEQRLFHKDWEEARKAYSEATAEEREAILGGLQAMNALFTSMSWRRSALGMQGAQQVYVCMDQLRRLIAVEIPAYRCSRKQSGSTLVMLGGPLAIITNYCVPAANALVAGYGAYRILCAMMTDDAPGGPSFESAVMENLSALAKGLQQVRHCQRLTQERFEQMFSGLNRQVVTTREAIQAQIDASTIAVLEGQAGIAYHSVVRELKEKLLKLQQQIDTFDPARHDPLDLLDELHNALNWACKDVASGVNFPDNLRETQFSRPIWVHLIGTNENHFSTLVGSLIEDRPIKIPNLAFFRAVLKGYHQVAEVLPPTTPNLVTLQEQLSEKGDQLLHFLASVKEAGQKVADLQNALLTTAFSWQVNRDNNERISAQIAACRNGSLTRLVGNDRNAIADRYKHWGMRSQVPFLGGTAIPTYRAPWGSATHVQGAIKQLEKFEPQLYRNWYPPAPETDPSNSLEVRDLSDVPCSFFSKSGTLIADLAISGRVSEVAIRRLTYVSLLGRNTIYQNPSLSETDFRVTMKPRIIYDARTTIFHSTAVANASLLASGEVATLPFPDGRTGRHRKGWSGAVTIDGTQYYLRDYDAAREKWDYDYSVQYKLQARGRRKKESTKELHRSMTSYLDRLERLEHCRFLPNSKIVGATDHSLAHIPLALPNELFERSTLKELALRIPCYAALVHEYELKCSADGKRYELRLCHSVRYPNEFDQETVQYGHTKLATFDSVTVRSFGAPVKKDGHLYNETPNYEEFLYVALYTATVGSIGLPGKGTLTLRNGALIVPVDKRFDGIEFIRKKSCILNYRSSEYDGTKESLQAMLGEPLQVEYTSVLPAARETAAAQIEPKLKRLSELTHALGLLLQLNEGCTANEARTTLADLGLIVTENTSVDHFLHTVGTLPRRAIRATQTFGERLMSRLVEADLGPAVNQLISELLNLPRQDKVRRVADLQVKRAALIEMIGDHVSRVEELRTLIPTENAQRAAELEAELAAHQEEMNSKGLKLEKIKEELCALLRMEKHK